MKLMKAGIRFAMAMAAAVAIAGAAEATTDVPAKFAYSGRLERADGAQIETRLPKPMSFRLYNRASGGRPLWGRTLPVRVEADGSFNVTLSDSLGSPSDALQQYESLSDAFASGGTDFWIGLSVENYDELLPRQKLAAVPRALSAVSADRIESLKADRLIADTVNIGNATVATLVVSNSLQSAGNISITCPDDSSPTFSSVNSTKILNGIPVGKVTTSELLVLNNTTTDAAVILWSNPYVRGYPGYPYVGFFPKGSSIPADERNYYVTSYNFGW